MTTGGDTATGCAQIGSRAIQEFGSVRDLAPVDIPWKPPNFFVRHRRAILGFVGVAVLLGAGQLSATLKIVDPTIASSPAGVVSGFRQFADSPTALLDLG